MGAAGCGEFFIFYGPWWRTHRKLLHDFIDVLAAKNYDANQVKAVSNFFVNLHRKLKTFRLTDSLALLGMESRQTPRTRFFACMKYWREGE